MGKLKKRKTRKDKVLTDLHRKLYTVNIPPSFAKNEPRKEAIVPVVTLPNTFSESYSHLIQDVKKTGIVTAAIIAGQAVLFLILKFHVIRIPGINY